MLQLISDIIVAALSRRIVWLVLLLVIPIASSSITTSSIWLWLTRLIMIFCIWRVWLPLTISLRAPMSICFGSRCRRYGHVTQRLHLVPIRMAHITELLSLDSDSLVMKYINGGVATSRDEMRQTITNSINHRWMAYDRGHGHFVGWFAVTPHTSKHLTSTNNDADTTKRKDTSKSKDSMNEYELGYRLRRRYWKKGYASEGAHCMLQHAFEELGASRVWAQTMTVNESSRRVMHRCGMTYVRTFFGVWDDVIDGSEHGDVEYEITHKQWIKHKSL
jgi:RimJ/RimL family protein N-acetyltransferase